MDGFHPVFLIILLALVVIIFGPGRLPELGDALGRSLRELRRASDGPAEADAEEPPKS